MYFFDCFNALNAVTSQKEIAESNEYFIVDVPEELRGPDDIRYEFVSPFPILKDEDKHLTAKEFLDKVHTYQGKTEDSCDNDSFSSLGRSQREHSNRKNTRCGEETMVAPVRNTNKKKRSQDHRRHPVPKPQSFKRPYILETPCAPLQFVEPVFQPEPYNTYHHHLAHNFAHLQDDLSLPQRSFLHMSEEETFPLSPMNYALPVDDEQYGLLHRNFTHLADSGQYSLSPRNYLASHPYSRSGGGGHFSEKPSMGNLSNRVPHHNRFGHQQKNRRYQKR